MRVVGFVTVLAVLSALVGVVVIRGRERDDRPGSGTTVRPFALPPDNGGSMRTTTAVPLPPGTGPATLPRGPRTNNEVALSLESALKRSSGWTHKVSCLPQGPLQPGEVLECHAASEPPIREAPPSTILAVVVDQQGRFVYAQKPDDSYTIEALTVDPGLSCDALIQRGYPYVVALAYWEANGRPGSLDPQGSGRPCGDRYPLGEIEQVLAGAR